MSVVSINPIIDHSHSFILPTGTIVQLYFLVPTYLPPCLIFYRRYARFQYIKYTTNSSVSASRKRRFVSCQSVRDGTTVPYRSKIVTKTNNCMVSIESIESSINLAYKYKPSMALTLSSTKVVIVRPTTVSQLTTE